LALKLEGKLLKQGLKAVLAIKDDDVRAQALAALAPQLPEKLRQQALSKELAVTLAKKDWWFGNAEALAALAPQLPEAMRQQALSEGLTGALAIEEELLRAIRLKALAPHLTGELLNQGFAAMLAMKNEEWGTQVTVLEALAPQLTGELLNKGLAVALAIKREDSRASALAALAPQLKGDQLSQGLTAALLLPLVGWTRVRALEAFAPLLTREMLPTLRVELLNFVLRLQYDRRSDFLGLCSLEKFFTSPILSTEILAAITEHLLEIYDEWQWL
jgi:hypothetical protein